MRIRKAVGTAVAVLLMSGCMSQTVEESRTPGESEVEQIADVEGALGLALRDSYGPTARVQRVFGDGPTPLVGVALTPPEPEADVTPMLAVAAFDANAKTLQVVARENNFREARRLKEGIALVSVDGTLEVRSGAGVSRVLSRGVRGDVSESLDGDRIAVTLSGGPLDTETSVAVLSADGRVVTIKDAAGVDDRPTLSPDGKTLVFVSGRTGIASLYRVDIPDGEPVQMTNAHLQPGMLSDDGDPEGFVPPPMRVDTLRWLNADEIRYDAGDGFWIVNIRSGAARREGGNP